MTNQNYNFAGKLIRAGGDAKTIKGQDKGYFTAIMYMTPHITKGQNLCPMAEKAGCLKGCLNTAGRGQMNSVQSARQRKAEFFVADRDAFMAILYDDIRRFINYCVKKDLKPCIRLNGTTDIRWENIRYKKHTIFELFPMVQFYDYTKIANRRNIPNNYHLTFSYSAANPIYARQVKIALDNGMNMAVVFRDKETIPAHFMGRPTVDGDKNDLRFLDPQQSIVALYAKGQAKHDQSGFVVDAMPSYAMAAE